MSLQGTKDKGDYPVSDTQTLSHKGAVTYPGHRLFCECSRNRAQFVRQLARHYRLHTTQLQVRPSELYQFHSSRENDGSFFSLSLLCCFLCWGKAPTQLLCLMRERRVVDTLLSSPSPLPCATLHHFPPFLRPPPTPATVTFCQITPSGSSTASLLLIVIHYHLFFSLSPKGAWKMQILLCQYPPS